MAQEETYREPGKWDRNFGVVVSPYLNGASDELGNITVDSDQPNQGPSVTSVTGFVLKARSGNTNNVRFSFDSATDSDGFELAAGEVMFVNVQNLNNLWFTTDTVGNKFCWIKSP